MTLEELSKFDGRDGRPAYIAVSNTIYDVSTSDLWQGGNHEGAHQAGYDLTTELKSAPHVRAVIDKFPVIGKIEEPKNTKKSDELEISPLSIAIIVFVVILMLITYMI